MTAFNRDTDVPLDANLAGLALRHFKPQAKESELEDGVHRRAGRQEFTDIADAFLSHAAEESAHFGRAGC